MYLDQGPIVLQVTAQSLSMVEDAAIPADIIRSDSRIVLFVAKRTKIRSVLQVLGQQLHRPEQSVFILPIRDGTAVKAMNEDNAVLESATEELC